METFSHVVSSAVGAAIVFCGAFAVATSEYAPTAASRNSPFSTAAACYCVYNVSTPIICPLWSGGSSAGRSMSYKKCCGG